MLHLRRLSLLSRKSLAGGISAREEIEVFAALAGLTDAELEHYEKNYPPPKAKPEPAAVLPSNPTVTTYPLTPEEEKAAEAKRAEDPEYQKRRKLAEAEIEKAAKAEKKGKK